MTAPDPTAGEREVLDVKADRLAAIERHGYLPEPDDNHTTDGRCKYPRTCPASPPAVAASTGTSEDVEALAEVIAGIDGGRLADASTRAHDACLRAARAVLASDWLAVRETAARAEERERIAQAIEADADHRNPLGFGISGAAMTRAARIAREGK